MAAVLELQKKSMDEVLLVYHQALDEARKANNLNLEVNILKAIIAIHQEHGYDFLNGMNFFIKHCVDGLVPCFPCTFSQNYH